MGKSFGKYGYAEKLIETYGEEGLVQQFYEFLQGKMHPDWISRENAPDLTKEQAWHMIYCMQEYFRIFDDRFKRCKICDCIYDSDGQGPVIKQATVPTETIEGSGKIKLQEFTEECGHYYEGYRADQEEK